MDQKSSGQNKFTWGECYLTHFETCLGEFTECRKFYRDDKATRPWMQIVSFDNVFDGCKAFCSMGLSLYSIYIGDVAEIFMPVDQAWEETPTILAAVLSYLIMHQMKIGRGQVVNFSKAFPDFVAKYNKSAIYFSTPFGTPEGFEQVTCSLGTGQVYLACYISEAEFLFKTTHGTEKFEDLLEEKQVDVFNITRTSCI